MNPGNLAPKMDSFNKSYGFGKNICWLFGKLVIVSEQIPRHRISKAGQNPRRKKPALT